MSEGVRESGSGRRVGVGWRVCLCVAEDEQDSKCALLKRTVNVDPVTIRNVLLAVTPFREQVMRPRRVSQSGWHL